MKKLTKIIAAAAMICCLFGCQKKAQSDYEYIKANGKMKMGITLFAPMNYQDTDGTLIGFDTDFAKAVCERLGIAAEFVEINWDLKETELSAKNVDCIWNGMTITEQIKENLSVSDPYLTNKQILITKRDKAEALAQSIDGISVSAEQGSAGEQTAASLRDKIRCTPVDSQTKALLEVKSGLSDAAIVDYVMSYGAIGEGTDFSDLVVVDRKLSEPELYGIAFRKDSDMTEQVNKIIASMKADGSLYEIAKKYRLEGLLTN